MKRLRNWLVWFDEVLFPNAYGFRQASDVMETCRRIVHTVHESAEMSPANLQGKDAK